MASVKRLSGLLLISSFVLLGEFFFLVNDLSINKRKSSYVSPIIKAVRGREREKDKSRLATDTIRNSYDNVRNYPWQLFGYRNKFRFFNLHNLFKFLSDEEKTEPKSPIGDHFGVWRVRKKRHYEISMNIIDFEFKRKFNVDIWKQDKSSSSSSSNERKKEIHTGEREALESGENWFWMKWKWSYITRCNSDFFSAAAFAPLDKNLCKLFVIHRRKTREVEGKISSSDKTPELN